MNIEPSWLALALSVAAIAIGGYGSYVSLKSSHSELKDRVKHLERSTESLSQGIIEIKVLLGRIVQALESKDILKK